MEATATKSLYDAIFDELAAGNVTLPMLPEIASLVIARATDEDSDAASLANLIQQDQSLTSHVLQISNSPAFSPRSPIVSLQQALARMGMRTVSELALAIAVKAEIYRVPGYEDELQSLWENSLATAVWAREIAIIRRHNVETAYLCGLLHQVGHPVTIQLACDLSKKTGMPLDKDEVMASLDDLSAHTGKVIAEKWSLPQVVFACIEHWQTPETDGEFATEIQITYLAHALAEASLSNQELDAADWVGTAGAQQLNLYPSDIEGLLGKQEMVMYRVTGVWPGDDKS